MTPPKTPAIPPPAPPAPAAFAVRGTITTPAQPVASDDTAKSAGDSLSIGWTFTGDITGFNVWYTINGGTPLGPVNGATPIAASPYPFPTGILNAMVGHNVRLIVKDSDASHPETASSASNSIDISGTISITSQSLAAGETLTVGGANESVDWLDHGVTTFHLVFHNGGG